MYHLYLYLLPVKSYQTEFNITEIQSPPEPLNTGRLQGVATR